MAAAEEEAVVAAEEAEGRPPRPVPPPPLTSFSPIAILPPASEPAKRTLKMGPEGSARSTASSWRKVGEGFDVFFPKFFPRDFSDQNATCRGIA